MADGALISQRSKEAVRERADIVELIEARTGPVRRVPRGMMARCPFHEERTASCSIDPVAKLFHCFGCGEGGDVFTLVQKLDNLSFSEAVEVLAERYGVELEYEQESPQAQQARDDARRREALLADARRFYARVLAESPAAEAARAYVAERRLSEEMIERFGLGFAPPDWDRLSRLATQKGYRAQELVDAGLASHGQRGPIDVFRGRLMFPLTDARGRVRGFAGRVMPGEEGAKYINSRETASFKKSQLLYGLHEARPAIGRSGRAIVVEGYTDVIQLHAAGFDTAVAAMGTSLTEEQLRELKRLCNALVLAFDADAAGQEAALRGLRRAEQLEFDVRIVPLPPGQDPADLALAGGGAVEAALAGTRRVLEFELDLVLARVGRDDPDAVYRDAQEILSRGGETILRQEQVRRISGALRLDERLTAGLVRRSGARSPAVVSGPARVPLDVEVRRERELLAAALAAPADGAEALAAAEADGFLSPDTLALLPWVRARLEGSDAPPPEGREAEGAAIVAAAARYGDAGPAAVRELAARVELAQVRRQRDVLKQKAAADEYTQEAQRALVELDRRIAVLEERVRAGS